MDESVGLLLQEDLEKEAPPKEEESPGGEGRRKVEEGKAL